MMDLRKSSHNGTPSLGVLNFQNRATGEPIINELRLSVHDKESQNRIKYVQYSLSVPFFIFRLREELLLTSNF